MGNVSLFRFSFAPVDTTAAGGGIPRTRLKLHGFTGVSVVRPPTAEVARLQTARLLRQLRRKTNAVKLAQQNAAEAMSYTLDDMLYKMSAAVTLKKYGVARAVFLLSPLVLDRSIRLLSLGWQSIHVVLVVAGIVHARIPAWSVLSCLFCCCHPRCNQGEEA